MDPAILAGFFTFFTLYGIWFPIPLTAINPDTPTPARIASALQLTATANSIASIFCNSGRPETDSIDSGNNPAGNNSTHLNTPLDQTEDGLGQDVQSSIGAATPTTFDSNPTSPYVFTESIRPTIYQDDTDSPEWILYTVYVQAKEEARSNPNTYTVVAITILLQIYLVLSVRRKKNAARRSPGPAASQWPATGMDNIHDEVAKERLDANSVLSKMEGFLSRFGANEEQVQSLATTVAELSQKQPERLQSTTGEVMTRIEDFASMPEGLQDQVRLLVLTNRGLGNTKILSPNYTVSEPKPEVSTTAGDENPKFESLQVELEKLKNDTTFLRDRLQDRSDSEAAELTALKDNLADLKNRDGTANEGLHDEFKWLRGKVSEISARMDKDESLHVEREAIRKKVSELSSRMDELQARPSELPAGAASSVELETLKVSVETLKQETARQSSLNDLSRQIIETSVDIRQKPWEQMNCTLVARLKDLESRTVTNEALGTLKEDLSATAGLFSSLDDAVQQLKIDLTTKSEHRELCTSVRDLQDSSEQLKTSLPKGQTDESTAIKLNGLSTAVKGVQDELKKLTSQYTDLSAKTNDAREGVTQLISEDIPKQREEYGRLFDRGFLEIQEKFGALPKTVADLSDKLDGLNKRCDSIADLEKDTRTSLEPLKSLQPSVSKIQVDLKSYDSALEGVKKRLTEVQAHPNLLPQGDGRPINLENLKKRVSDVETMACKTAQDLNREVDNINIIRGTLEGSKSLIGYHTADIGKCLDELRLEPSKVNLSGDTQTSAANNKKPSFLTSKTPKEPVHIESSSPANATPPAEKGVLVQDGIKSKRNVSRRDPVYTGPDKLITDSDKAATSSTTDPREGKLDPKATRFDLPERQSKTLNLESTLMSPDSPGSKGDDQTNNEKNKSVKSDKKVNEQLQSPNSPKHLSDPSLTAKKEEVKKDQPKAGKPDNAGEEGKGIESSETPAQSVSAPHSTANSAKQKESENPEPSPEPAKTSIPGLSLLSSVTQAPSAPEPAQEAVTISPQRRFSIEGSSWASDVEKEETSRISGRAKDETTPNETPAATSTANEPKEGSDTSVKPSSDALAPTLDTSGGEAHPTGNTATPAVSSDSPVQKDKNSKPAASTGSNKGQKSSRHGKKR